jgi:hypothetical protein
MARARYDARPDLGFGLLGLDEQEVEEKFRFRMCHQREVRVNALRDSVVEFDLNLEGRIRWFWGAHDDLAEAATDCTES